jgi:hypothetical protein
MVNSFKVLLYRRYFHREVERVVIVVVLRGRGTWKEIALCGRDRVERVFEPPRISWDFPKAWKQTKEGTGDKEFLDAAAMRGRDLRG